VRVCDVVPARNGANTIASTVTALLTQKFNGTLHVIIVDDHSEDQTASAISNRHRWQQHCRGLYQTPMAA